jgi:hypothetical protein
MSRLSCAKLRAENKLHLGVSVLYKEVRMPRAQGRVEAAGETCFWIFEL